MTAAAPVNPALTRSGAQIFDSPESLRFFPQGCVPSHTPSHVSSPTGKYNDEELDTMTSTALSLDDVDAISKTVSNMSIECDCGYSNCYHGSDDESIMESQVEEQVLQLLQPVSESMLQVVCTTTSSTTDHNKS